MAKPFEFQKFKLIHLTTAYVLMYMTHNSLGHEQPSGLDVKQSPNAQDAFQPIPGLISCAGVTVSVGITCIITDDRPWDSTVWVVHYLHNSMKSIKNGIFLFLTKWL